MSPVFLCVDYVVVYVAVVVVHWRCYIGVDDCLWLV